MEKKINALWVGLLVVSLLTGFILGKVKSERSFDKYNSKSIGYKSVERDERLKSGADPENSWKFINPLLDCKDLENISTKSIEKTKQDLLDFIEEQKSQGINDVAIYFRDLNNGPWFGIKEKEEFLPASLLKVPLMMSVFKQAMSEPEFLSRQFIWTGESNNKEYFRAEKELEKNRTYTVSDAVGHMIRYSDNNSSHILSYALNTSTLLASYSELGIPTPDKLGYSVSARTYASFFRILYNSTFLSKDYSEEALHLLSEVAFKKGLVAGVPPSIKVAHKFGERQFEGAAKQLHDCGIVYYPDKPYLLCVMTRSSSSSFEKMAEFIAQVSSIVYEGVSNN